jgi:hypothetical protein
MPHEPNAAVDGLDLSGLSEHALGQVATRLLSRDFEQWAEQLSRVGNCAHPVKLVGSTQTVNTATGELLGSYSSNHELDGVTRIACGNRRASRCPACSRVYAADTWHLINSGAAGGKGVPDSVGQHPMVFATATAPSFGAVHSIVNAGAGRCRPRREKHLCRHGKPTWCNTTHSTTDRLAGQPLCPECYDYDSHVIWQWHAPELWRRFTITLNRALARHLTVRPSYLKFVASIQFAKVAEYQRRGVIHFHALIRFDGPKTPGGFAAPPRDVTAEDLADLIRRALAQVSYDAPPIDADDVTRRLGFGAQIDARAVTTKVGDDSEALTPSQVAGYIAKYATKTLDDPDTTDPTSPHYARIRDTVRDLHRRSRAADTSIENPYALLGKWDHMLGFRGHFSTKSRKYSTTLGALRGARRKWQAVLARAQHKGQVVDLVAADLENDTDNETTLVISSWRYVGQGWANQGETALATAAAARAREHQRERAARRHSSSSKVGVNAGNCRFGSNNGEHHAGD